MTGAPPTSRGERLCVIEAGGARLAILVCEDLARLHAFSGTASHRAWRMKKARASA